MGAGDVGASTLAIDLQRHSEDGGYTDIELLAPNSFHIIVEAKRGWTLPQEAQLKRYVSRLQSRETRRMALVSISAADRAYAARLPPQINGVKLVHLAWSDVRAAVQRAYTLTRGAQEKLWLRELDAHLEAFVMVQDLSDNNVYVVSLADYPIKPGHPYTWIDVVNQDRRYFHPVGTSGWPVIPPNYIGFRYRGQLQSVHHVDNFEVVPNLAALDPRWPDTDIDHFVYRLGPPMRPMSPMRTGEIYRAGRVWCAIDALLSGEFPTISAARDETKHRLASKDADQTLLNGP